MQSAHLLGVIAVAFGIVSTPSVQAQSTDQQAPKKGVPFFAESRWSLFYPDRDFKGGCVVGFSAFEFSPTGYFTYNNHIHGSWQVDSLGNLKLKTKDGYSFRMVAYGTAIAPVGDLPFAKRTYIYRKCDTH